MKFRSEMKLILLSLLHIINEKLKYVRQNEVKALVKFHLTSWFAGVVPDQNTRQVSIDKQTKACC